MKSQRHLLDERQDIAAEDADTRGANEDRPVHKCSVPSFVRVRFGIVKDEETLDHCTGEKRGASGDGDPAKGHDVARKPAGDGRSGLGR